MYFSTNKSMDSYSGNTSNYAIRGGPNIGYGRADRSPPLSYEGSRPMRGYEMIRF